jgi:uncharacterized repeat protein (TIGR03806 family)
MRMHVAVTCALVILAACGGGGGGSGGADSTGGGDFGLDARAAVSGLQIPIDASGGSGQVTPVNAFPNFRVPNGTFLTGAKDGTNRVFVSYKNGWIRSFANDRNTTLSDALFLDISSRVDDTTGEGGLLGLAFDPAFASNGYFYVTYTPRVTPRTVRLSQFRVATIGGNSANASSERILLERPSPLGSHYGGWIGFGPEGNNTLYISTGDNNAYDVAQDTNNLQGKILRIRINSSAGSYSIPSDNPYGNAVWARGFRNPWRCSFDRAAPSGQPAPLWCGDVGEGRREEVNRITRGSNHGWPWFEGSVAFSQVGQHNYADFTAPVYEYDHNGGVAAVIGGYIYRGSGAPALAGRYLFGDNVILGLNALQLNGSGGLVSQSVVAPTLPEIRSMGEDDNGEVYALAGDGTIYRFQANGGGGPAPTMPATLSATGLFTDTAALTPAPFLVDYSVNAPFWSDGAVKRRWFVLPDGQNVTFSANDNWSFPVGSITVKHFELGSTRVETRVMVHRTDGWAGFTYRWRADQREADLLTSGATATVAGQSWTFPSSAQCLNCHTTATGRVLGLTTRQINRSHTYAATGRSDNQLRTLAHIGVFSGSVDAASSYATMPDPRDAAAPLADRARAYLDTNCSICHRPNGPTPVSMDMRYTTALADTRLVNVAPEAGSSGGVVRVVPGNHAASNLWQRVQSTNSAVRMPPLGVNVVDAEAVQLLSTWIDSLQ